MKLTRGSTLPELLMVLGILTILFSIVTITLLRSERVSAQGAQVDTFITDLRDQQTNAMTKDSGYGIFLETTSYVLFKGSAYDAADPSNFKVQLDGGLEFNGVTFPNSTIIFASGSGEIVGYSSSTNDLGINDTAGGARVGMELNKYGAPIEQ